MVINKHHIYFIWQVNFENNIPFVTIKITDKNLINSSPLFRQFQRKITFFKIFGTTRCPNITGNIVAIYKKFLPYLPERHGGFYRSSDERKSERVTVRLLYAIGLIVIDHYFPINMEKAHGLQFISMRLFTIILILNCFPIILNA